MDLFDDLPEPGMYHMYVTRKMCGR